MKIFRGLEEASQARLRSPVVTLGVFDGVHLGHRLLLDHVVRRARDAGKDAVVVTFAQHPRAVLRGEVPMWITSLDHRLRLFSALGMSAAVVLEFDASLQVCEAEEFAERVFGRALGASHVVLGYNNRFGRGGKGDLSTLLRVGPRLGFTASQVDEVRVGERPVSSTVIREAILAGELERASLLLGRPFSVLGTVVHGDQLGRKLGFPTANLDLHHEVRPPRGVYGAEVSVLGARYWALVNVGVRPTVGVPSEGSTSNAWVARDRHDRIEVFLLDVSGDLYGADLEVFFLYKLRDERKFAGLAELTEQIERDLTAFRHRQTSIR